MKLVFKEALKKLNPVLNARNSYYRRGHYYDQLVSDYSKISSYLCLNKINSEKNKLPIEVPIGNFSEMTPKMIKNTYGRPYFRIVNNFKSFKTKILCYRVKIGGHKVRLELHFFEGNVLFYSYTFMYLKNEEIFKITDIFKNKYKVLKFDTEKDALVDSSDCRVSFLQKQDSLKIQYINGESSEFFSKVNQVYAKQTEREFFRVSRNNEEVYHRL